MKRTYLLIIYGVGCVEITRKVCQSIKQAKKEMEHYNGFHVTGNLLTAEYSVRQGDYIPKQLVKQFHS